MRSGAFASMLGDGGSTQHAEGRGVASDGSSHPVEPAPEESVALQAADDQTQLEEWLGRWEGGDEVPTCPPPGLEEPWRAVQKAFEAAPGGESVELSPALQAHLKTMTEPFVRASQALERRRRSEAAPLQRVPAGMSTTCRQRRGQHGRARRAQPSRRRGRRVDSRGSPGDGSGSPEGGEPHQEAGDASGGQQGWR
jgi:hypothetical protein